MLAFGTKHVICTFSKGKDRCVNVAASHDKGHQNAKGKVIDTGKFESDFNHRELWPQWKRMVGEEISRIDNELQVALDGSQEIVRVAAVLAKMHSKHSAGVYDLLGSAKQFRSHTTCFCCLMQPPQHTLPCGHTLCSACVRSYGSAPKGSSSTSVVVLGACPLHTDTESWFDPHIIRFKPTNAGLRLLSLDG